VLALDVDELVEAVDAEGAVEAGAVDAAWDSASNSRTCALLGARAVFVDAALS
jgi:hypothetical protein